MPNHQKLNEKTNVIQVGALALGGETAKWHTGKELTTVYCQGKANESCGERPTLCHENSSGDRPEQLSRAESGETWGSSGDLGHRTLGCTCEIRRQWMLRGQNIIDKVRIGQTGRHVWESGRPPEFSVLPAVGGV